MYVILDRSCRGVKYVMLAARSLRKMHGQAYFAYLIATQPITRCLHQISCFVIENYYIGTLHGDSRPMTAYNSGSFPTGLFPHYGSLADEREGFFAFPARTTSLPTCDSGSLHLHVYAPVDYLTLDLIDISGCERRFDI
jgi:hypothetical protein